MILIIVFWSVDADCFLNIRCILTVDGSLFAFLADFLLQIKQKQKRILLKQQRLQLQSQQLQQQKRKRKKKL